MSKVVNRHKNRRRNRLSRCAQEGPSYKKQGSSKLRLLCLVPPDLLGLCNRVSNTDSGQDQDQFISNALHTSAKGLSEETRRIQNNPASDEGKHQGERQLLYRTREQSSTL